MFAAVSFVFREVLSFTKLNQLAANITSHDHRADGTQGAPMVGEWTSFDTLSAVSGWSIADGPRYRVLAGGTVVAIDVSVTRTGAQLDASTVDQANPGNFADAQILSGIPAAIRPTVDQYVVTDKQDNGIVSVRVDAAGTATLVAGVPSGAIQVGATIKIRGLLWLD